MRTQSSDHGERSVVFPCDHHDHLWAPLNSRTVRTVKETDFTPGYVCNIIIQGNCHWRITFVLYSSVLIFLVSTPNTMGEKEKKNQNIYIFTAATVYTVK